MNKPGVAAPPSRTIQLSGSLLLTLRELWATYVTLGLFVVATIAWLVLSLAMNLDVVEGSVSALRIFGIQSTPTNAIRDPATGEWIQQAMGLDQFVIGIKSFVFGASYFLGTLLGIFATAPLTTALMEEARIGLLLSKPISRRRLLAGHTGGVFLTVLVLSTYLVTSVWLVLSFKTGIWDPAFLVAIPIITVMFAAMYGVVLLLSVTTRSSGAALITTYGLIFISVILSGHEQLTKVLGTTARTVFNVLYAVLPNFVEVIPLTAQLISHEAVESWFPLTSSLLFGAVTYLAAFLWFTRKDF